MKQYIFLLLTTAIFSCSNDSKDDQKVADVPTSAPQNLSNVSYGPDPQQLIDIYLPAGSVSTSTKVLILVHGGGWSGGSKDDMAGAVTLAKLQFPDHAIVNVGYRLATSASPAYPKQINDLEAVISHLENGNYPITKQYGFIGVSAGAHLSMLYAYNFDPQRKVKAVCSIVGPTDFNDPAYVGSPLQAALLPYLTSNEITEEYLAEVSPITYVKTQSAPTIQFAGNADPLIPVSQGQRLKAKLDSVGVANELSVYNAGHGNFSVSDTQQIYAKLKVFFDARL